MYTFWKGQLAGYTIQQDISYPETFTHRMNENPEFKSCFETFAAVESMMRMTVNQRILGFFESTFSIKYRILTDPVYKDLAIHPFVLSTETDEIYHGLSKKGITSETLKKIEDGYSQCIEDGTIQRILDKWYSE